MYYCYTVNSDSVVCAVRSCSSMFGVDRSGSGQESPVLPIMTASDDGENSLFTLGGNVSLL